MHPRVFTAAGQHFLVESDRQFAEDEVLPKGWIAQRQFALLRAD
jgi:hypothetical protein